MALDLNDWPTTVEVLNIRSAILSNELFTGMISPLLFPSVKPEMNVVFHKSSTVG